MARRRRSRERSPYMVYHAVRLFAGAVAALPLPLVHLFGLLVGFLVPRFDRRHVLVARENLDRAYGGALSTRERDEIIRGVYRNLGLILVELICAPRLLGRGRWRERIEIEGMEHARAAAADGKGVIFVSGHIGNWEWLGAVAAIHGYPLHTIYRPLDNPFLDRYLRQARTRFGQKLIPQTGSVLPLGRCLREGGFLGMLVDQNQAVGGVFVDFFGRPASTMRAPAALHRRTGAPIVTGYIRRVGPFRHRIRIDPPIRLEPTADPEEDLLRVAQAYTERLETYVREAPEQWLWLHRRWRTRPPGEDAPGGAPARRPLPVPQRAAWDSAASR